MAPEERTTGVLDTHPDDSIEALIVSGCGKQCKRAHGKKQSADDEIIAARFAPPHLSLKGPTKNTMVSNRTFGTIMDQVLQSAFKLC